MDPPKQYICHCQKKCGILGKIVSKSTFNRHRRQIPHVPQFAHLLDNVPTPNSQQPTIRKRIKRVRTGNGPTEDSRENLPDELQDSRDADDEGRDPSASEGAIPPGDINVNIPDDEAPAGDDSLEDGEAPPSDDGPSATIEEDVDEIQTANQSILYNKTASLDDSHSHLNAQHAHRLRDPPQYQLDTSDRFFRLSINMYIDSPGENEYSKTRENLLRCYPDCAMLSYDQIKRRVAEHTGIFPYMH